MLQVVAARHVPGDPGATNQLAVPLGPQDQLRTVGPFAMVGRHARVGVEPGALPVDADVRPHPHIGLVAVTWLVQGHVTHRDSLGHRCELHPGSVLSQVAGRGIVHSERYDRLRLLGGDIELFQMLLALPDGEEDVPPDLRFVPAAEVPVERTPGVTVVWLSHPSPDRAAALRLPAPTLLADVTLDPGARWSAPAAAQRALFVVRGAVVVQGVRVDAGHVVHLPVGVDRVEADGSSPARLLALGGAPVGPRYQWWNYLHSSLERIEEAKAAWREERVPRPVGDTESFTPAPPDDGRPLLRLNRP